MEELKENMLELLRALEKQITAAERALVEAKNVFASLVEIIDN